jgi:hypothetical protein
LSPPPWPRIAAASAVFALVYNALWGLAWLAFMRAEWIHAVAAIGEPLPWTPAVWLLWVLVTLSIGVGIMTHAAAQSRPRLAAVRAGAVTWLVLTLGMAAASLHQSLALRVVTLDSVVNLVGIVVGSVGGAALLRQG